MKEKRKPKKEIAKQPHEIDQQMFFPDLGQVEAAC